MMNFADKILKLDRRWVFLVGAIGTAIPIIQPLNLPVYVTPEVRGVFDEIEKIPEGSAILIAFDYEPGSTPECDPMSVAVLRHCFRRNLRVIGVTILAVAVGPAERVLTQVANEMGKERGKDYTFLGFKSDRAPTVVGMSISIQRTFQTDRYGNETASLPVLQGVGKLADFPYMVEIADDSILEYWIMYAHDTVGLKIGSCCTAVIASGIYPFLNSGQLTGIVGGLKGASEYEKLVGFRGMASRGMDSQAVIHIFIIVLMVVGNIAFLVSRKTSQRRQTA